MTKIIKTPLVEQENLTKSTLESGSHSPALVLQAVHSLEPGDWVEQLHPERSQAGLPVQEEEVAARPRVLHRVLDEVHDRAAFELGVAAEAKVAYSRR